MITKGKWKVGQRYYLGKKFITSGKTDVCELLEAGTEHNQPTKLDAEDNANLIAEAGTTYNETGLTPSQLAEQRKDLLALLKDQLKWDGILPHMKQRIADTIAKATN